MRSNLSSSERAFCGEELLDCIAPPASIEVEALLLLVSSGTDVFSSFDETFAESFFTSAQADSLRSLPSTSTLMVPLTLLLCKEFVLRGGAGGCLVFVTDKLREQCCLLVASSGAPNDPDTLDSDP